MTNMVEPVSSPAKAPGPPGRFGVRNIALLVRDQLEGLRDLADRYGDLVSMKVMGSDWFLVFHPDDIETTLVKNAALVGRDAYSTILQRVLGLGLLTSDGDLWKRQRKLMAQAFTPKRIHSYGAAMVAVTDRGLAWQDGQPINLHAEMSRITMEVVANVLFGTAIGTAQVDVVRHSMEVINEFLANSPEAVVKLPAWVPTPRNHRVNRAVAELDAVIYGIIAERRGGEQRDDVLGTLLAAQDDDGAGMSDKQLRDEAITLFLAGHETTALALAHTLYLLSKHPADERRLHDELSQVIGRRLPTADDVKRLPFTERVLKESMRLYPPAWTTGREVKESFQLRGVTIPKGAQLLLSQWVVHRDPRFFPNPEGFDPDRWTPERASSLPRYAYFPFGGGPRVCIGNHFAMMEATLLLATIVQRYRLELLPGQRLELKPSVTLRQRGEGLKMRVRQRLADASTREVPDETVLAS